MIPIRDENPTQTKPWVTYALVAANIAIFIYTQTPDGVRFMASGVMVPKEVLHGAAPVREFHTDGQVITAHPLMPVWLTIFSSMFLHANWLHVGGNMLYLWIFGNNIEDNLGHLRFLLFYLACGVAAAFAQIYSDPTSTVPNLGASGAIAGVLGAYLVLYSGVRVLTVLILPPFIRTTYLPAWLVLGFWFVLQVIENLGRSGSTQGAGGVAYMAHIGGFAAGLVLVFLFGGKRRRFRPRYYEEAFPNDGYER